MQNNTATEKNVFCCTSIGFIKYMNLMLYVFAESGKKKMSKWKYKKRFCLTRRTRRRLYQFIKSFRHCLKKVYSEILIKTVIIHVFTYLIIFSVSDHFMQRKSFVFFWKQRNFLVLKIKPNIAKVSTYHILQFIRINFDSVVSILLIRCYRIFKK